MRKSNLSKVDFELRKIFKQYSHLFIYHQWPSEHLRWVELIFALVSRICDKPEPDVRHIIVELDDLGLLEAKELSEIPATEGEVDLTHPVAGRILEFLNESGFSKQQARQSVLIMKEAAQNLRKYHGGKIQKYLRKYGQQMIEELSQNFTFSKMDKKEVRYAFTYWLQNILNMPINLEMKSTELFCKKFKISEKDLTEEADHLDINVALLDDMIEQYIVSLGGAKRGRASR